MAGAQAEGTGGELKMTYIEEQLAVKIGETSKEVAHTECFDTEERAEVYTILEALKLGTEAHRTQVKLLAKRLREKTADV